MCCSGRQVHKVFQVGHWLDTLEINGKLNDASLGGMARMNSWMGKNYGRKGRVQTKATRTGHA